MALFLIGQFNRCFCRFAVFSITSDGGAACIDRKFSLACNEDGRIILGAISLSNKTLVSAFKDVLGALYG